ncbi:MAG: TlpA family protein disulfide reductase [Flavobacteriaceae bacterium]|nr:TlpA family protein disulfide reductase [Flavobacteriaceae bacterium]
MKRFLTKHWSTLLILLFVAFLLIPQTGMPIKVFINRMISFSPSEISEEKQTQLKNYNWELVTLSNEKANFAASEGKVTLVNFWATWCPPCLAEMPSLQSLFNDYGDKVDFYLVSMESSEKLTSFMEKKGYEMPVYIPKKQLPEGLSAYSFPTTYIVSKQGKIVVDKTGSANWNSQKVRALLDRLLSEKN